MIIESLIKREGGSVITLDGAEYHFEPNSKGDHVCSITEQQHVNRLLSIKDGFAKYEQESNPTKPANRTEPEPTQEEPEQEGYAPAKVIEPQQEEDATEATQQAEEGHEELTERDQLIAEYTEKFGRSPHPRIGIKKLKEQLGKD